MAIPPLVCANCGSDISAKAGTGNPKRYCSGRCRTIAYRRRSRVPAAAIEFPTRPPVAVGLVGRRSPERVLVEAVADMLGLVVELARTAEQLPPATRVAAAMLADDLAASLERHFPGVGRG